MHWITEHWEILAPLVAAGIAFLFDIVLRIRGKELVPIRAYLYVILLLLAAVSFALVSQDRPQIDHLAVHLKMDYTNGNPYLNELIDSNLSRLKNGLSGEEFVTGSLESTLAELNRGMQSLGNGDIIRAIDYGIPWQKEFKDYQAANLVASTKHVAITRIFIIPDLILQDAQKKKDL